MIKEKIISTITSHKLEVGVDKYLRVLGRYPETNVGSFQNNRRPMQPGILSLDPALNFNLKFF